MERKHAANFILLAWLIIGLLVGNAKSAFAAEKWFRLATDHFTMVGNSKPAGMQKLAAQLDRFWDAQQKITPFFRLSPPLPILVYVFNDATDIRLFSPRQNGKYVEFAGYFQAGMDSYNLVLHTRATSIDSVIYHELEHAIIHDNAGKWPLCLNEGFAEFMSTFHLLDHGATIKVGSPIAYHLATLRNQPLIGLKTLFEVDQSSPYYNDKDKVYRFYAESWALVHYLLLGNRQKRAQQFDNFLQLIGKNSPIAESFQKAFGVPFNIIERELSNYIQLMMLPELTFRGDSIAKPKSAAAVEPLGETDIHRYSGDLMANIDSYQKAETQLKLALRGDSNQGLLHAALGSIYLKQARWEEAEEQTSKALAYQPEEYRVQLMRGMALTQTGHGAAGLKHLLEASRLRPEVPVPYLFQSLAYMELGDQELASRSMSRALQVDSSEQNCWGTRAEEAFVMGHPDIATADALMYCHQKGWTGAHSDYMALLAIMGYLKQKQNEEAANLAGQALQELNSKEWPFPVFRYLKGQLTETELLKKASGKGELTEAQAYIGLKFLYNNQSEQALPYLNWVGTQGEENYLEHLICLVELQRLKTGNNN